MLGQTPSRLAGALAVAAVLLSAAPGLAAAPRIVGGGPATRNYPYAAYVEVTYPGGRGFCGGSLVAARFVVTAGHCLEPDLLGQSPTHVDVAVGVTRVDHAHSLDSAASTIPPENRYHATAVRHPAFASSAEGETRNDVAVLTLSRPAPQSQVRMPRTTDSALWEPGTPGVAIGWGRTSNPSLLGPPPTLSDDLLEVSQPVLADVACSGYRQYSAEVALCAGGEPGRDTCNGDSGGPLLVSDAGGAPVLAGATSYGPDPCATGQPGVYARIGGASINTWLRTQIPQVEIDRDVADPAAGQAVTFTAVPANPLGTGPLGGYDALEWDLDGNGTFEEAPGALSVTVPMRAGLNTISVLARAAAGDAEVRTLHVTARERALVSFASAGYGVREGEAAVLALARSRPGGGSVTVTPSAGTAALGADVTGTPRTASFAAADSFLSVSVPTREDRVAEPPETFRVELSGFAGDLLAGSPAAATVTIHDDDATVVGGSTVRVRRGRFDVRVRAGAGRLRVVAGRTAATPTRRISRFGTHRLRARLTRRAAQRLASRGRLRVRLTVSYTPDGGRRTSVRRTLTLRGV